jgi:hypothetical protein
VRDVAKVLACLKRAIKIVSAAKQQRAAAALPADGGHVALYLEILSLYLQFYEEGSEVVGASMVQQMVELIREEVARGEASARAGAGALWEATVAHVRQRQAAGGEVAARLAALQL